MPRQKAQPERKYLTKTVADAARPHSNRKRDRLIYDADKGRSKSVSGFALKVRPSGHKTFILVYRSNGKPRRFHIGRYGDLTVQAAREKARRLRAEVDSGNDPFLEKQKASERRLEEGSLGELCDSFLTKHSKQFKREVSWKEDARRIETRIKPRLGHLMTRSVTEEQVDDLFRDIGQDHPIEANRVLVLLATIYAWAMRKGHLPGDSKNPAKRSRQDLYPEVERARVLKSDEKPRLLEAIDDEPDPFHRAIFRLLLLTGLRKSELLHARYSDLDVTEATLHLPKTKSGKPRTIPLSDDATEIIRSLPRCVGNDHIFPAHVLDRRTGEVRFREGNRAMNNPNKQWARIRAEAGCPDLRIHDLRRTASCTVIRATGNPRAAQKILGHADLGTTMRHYAAIEAEEVRSGVEALARALRSETRES